MIYSQNDIGLMFLSSLPFYTYKKEDLIVEAIGEPKNILSLTIDDKNVLKQILENDDFATLIKYLEKFDKDAFISDMEKRGIKCITYLDNNYPSIFTMLKEPPRTLYYVGDISLLDTRCLAVVGSRTPTIYGKQITEKFVKSIAECGITIVSGLATGIDKFSHETTLKVGGKTIAFLGCGFNHIYPASNINLARQVADLGLLITEYHPDTRATRYTFPFRNRLIACVSEGVLITEASFKSGTIYTKDYALELGKELYAVPGSIISEKSELPNMLIKSGQCNVVTCAEDILIKYGIKKGKNKNKKIEQLSIEEQAIVDLLKLGEKNADEIYISTKIPIKDLTSYLTTLEIRGIIKKSQNNTYVIN